MNKQNISASETREKDNIQLEFRGINILKKARELDIAKAISKMEKFLVPKRNLIIRLIKEKPLNL